VTGLDYDGGRDQTSRIRLGRSCCKPKKVGKSGFRGSGVKPEETDRRSSSAITWVGRRGRSRGYSPCTISSFAAAAIIDGNRQRRPLPGTWPSKAERMVGVGGRQGPASPARSNATGLLVTPGWVTAHTHYDGTGHCGTRLAGAFVLARRQPRRYSAIAGVGFRFRCGRSIGRRLMELMEGVRGNPRCSSLPTD